jgi:hypothetical protein
MLLQEHTKVGKVVEACRAKHAQFAIVRWLVIYTQSTMKIVRRVSG